MMEQFLRFELRSQLIIFFMLSILGLFTGGFIRLQQVAEEKALGLIRRMIIAYRYTIPIPVSFEEIQSITRKNLSGLPVNLQRTSAVFATRSRLCSKSRQSKQELYSIHKGMPDNSRLRAIAMPAPR